MRRILLVLVGAGVLMLQPSALLLAQEVTGLWLTAEGESQIEIYQCGEVLCGRVASMAEPFNKQGQPRTDKNNPDPALQGRFILGMDILTDLKPGEDPGVWEGSVYNPRDGEVYAVTLTLKGDVLEVEGCMAYVLCDSQDWTRVKPPR